MLIRNPEPRVGLYKETWLVLSRLGNHVLKEKILNVKNANEKILNLKTSITLSYSRFSFKYQCMLFSIIVSYAIIINKGQGQSFSHVGIFFWKKSIFSHGQLYVVVSRVKSRSGLEMLICDKNNNNSFVIDFVV